MKVCTRELSFEPVDVDELHTSTTSCTPPIQERMRTVTGTALCQHFLVSQSLLPAFTLPLKNDAPYSIVSKNKSTTRVTPTRPIPIKAAASTHTPYAHTHQEQAVTTVYSATATLSRSVNLRAVMSLAISKTFGPISPFKHAPLDHTQPSIRIIKVLPHLSREGLLQCTIAHGTTADDYTCLSYTWGHKSTGYPIFIDGQLFMVRQNLRKFLYAIRQIHPLRPLWIDAVCIDQNNIAERNHQVAQMGAIYAAAAHVMIWLGNNSKIADFFRIRNDRSQHVSKLLRYTRSMDPLDMDLLDMVEDGWVELANHAYWTRAWITQEIAHSRALSMLADVVETHDFHRLSRTPWFAPIKADKRFLVHMDIARQHHSVLGKPLSYLLKRLPHQECHHPRDRIYALLGMAAEGSAIRVDYDSSDMEFISMLLETCPELSCLCSLVYVHNVLGNMKRIDIRESTDAQFFKLALPTPRNVTIPHEKSWSGSGEQKTGCPLLSRKDRVFIFRMSGVCQKQSLGDVLEVVDVHEESGGQQMCRIARVPRVPETSYAVRWICPWHYYDCRDDRSWWDVTLTFPEKPMHFDSERGSWQPGIGVQHHTKLWWSYQPRSGKLVSNWFRVRLQVTSVDRCTSYILHVPFAVILSYTQQSTALGALRRQVWQELYPCDLTVGSSPSRTVYRGLCSRAQSGRGTLKPYQKDQDS